MQVHQFHPSIVDADAIGGQITVIRRLLLNAGIGSELFSAFPSPDFSAPTRLFDAYAPYSSAANVLLLHYSIAYPDEVWAWLRALPDRKIVVYHNITPPHYFAGVNAHYLDATRRGLKQLALLRQLTAEAWGDSEFNCQTLRDMGWENPRVLPIIFETARYDIPADPGILAQMNDGHPNILFVGRCAPNKRWEDILAVFYHLKHHVAPDARLWLIGSASGMEPYAEFLHALVDQLHIQNVTFVGQVTQAELVAYYQSAAVYLCMSSHEGFCVPLVESMHFGVPIVAYAAAAVPETLGGAGLLVKRKDHRAIAELVGMLIHDQDLRSCVIRQQRERLKAFNTAVVGQQLLDYLPASVLA